MAESIETVLEQIQDTNTDGGGEVTIELTVFHDDEEWLVAHDRPLSELDPRPRNAVEDALEEFDSGEYPLLIPGTHQYSRDHQLV